MDVHKKVLMVVVMDASTPDAKPIIDLAARAGLDAERLVRRLIANELILSFVPVGEQRTWRNLTRMKLQFATGYGCRTRWSVCSKRC